MWTSDTRAQNQTKPTESSNNESRDENFAAEEKIEWVREVAMKRRSKIKSKHSPQTQIQVHNERFTIKIAYSSKMDW